MSKYNIYLINTRSFRHSAVTVLAYSAEWAAKEFNTYNGSLSILLIQPV